MWEAIQQALASVKDSIYRFLAGVGYWLGEVPSEIGSKVNEVITLVNTAVQKALEGAGGEIVKALSIGQEVLSDIRSRVNNFITLVGEAPIRAIQSALDDIRGQIGSTIQRVNMNKEMVEVGTEEYLRRGNSRIESIKHYYESTAKTETQTATDNMDQIRKDQEEQTGDALKGLINALKNIAAINTSGIEDLLKGVAGSLGSSIKALSEQIAGAMSTPKSLMDQVRSGIEGVVLALSESVIPSIDGITLALLALQDFLDDMFEEFFKIDPEKVIDFYDQLERAMLERKVGVIRR
jgi:phage-related protein